MVAAKKSETVTFRMDSQTLELIRRAAKIQGRSVTSFVTQAARVEAQKEILDQRFIEVDAETFEDIEKMLAEPGKVDEKLVELFRKTPKWLD
jgi:uncharacterized protein (DUF1778 family)